MEGHLQNAKGHWVPLDRITELEKARNEVVYELAGIAEALQAEIRRVKRQMADTLTAFAAMSREEHGVMVGGEKGNINLYSFDGTYRVVRQQSERMVFDETLSAAKALIDECLSEWTEDTRPELRAIISEAFDTDAEGRISHSRIQELCRMKIDDERWTRAVGIIGKSKVVVDTASYVRVYKRDANGKHQPISLDIAKL